MELSILIVTWKCVDYLRACIASIQRETLGIRYEIIVVDNASGDNSERIITAEFPSVKFFASPDNLGFAKGNNLAFRHSTGSLVLFLNPDTEIKDDVLTRMAKYLSGSTVAGAVGAHLLNSDGSLQASCVQAQPTIFNQLIDSEALRSAFPHWSVWGTEALWKSEPSSVQAISGACFMAKREVFEEVGLFTESYFMYVEDIDLSGKITRAGHELHYLPDCEVVHHGGQSSSKQGAFFQNVHQRESLLRYFRRTRGGFYCLCYRASLAAFAAMRIVLILLSVLAGPLAFRGKGRREVLGRWLANFRWAIGAEVS
jgi:N-acetylglucosaminyl-diphospho-decaprenol L-rhamnosyltransferase